MWSLMLWWVREHELTGSGNAEILQDGCHSQLGKERPREVQSLAQSHRAPKWWSQTSANSPSLPLTSPSFHSCPQPSWVSRSWDGPCPHLHTLLPGGRAVLVCPNTEDMHVPSIHSRPAPERDLPERARVWVSARRLSREHST